MAKKLVIFDLDGTLLNTISDLAMATNQALEQLGFPTHSEEAYKIFVGNGIDILFERALPETERNAENILKMRALFLPYYQIHNSDFTAPYFGILNTLQTLKQNGIKLAVATNKYHEAAIEVMDNYFPEIEFDVVFGHREGYLPKPDPAIVFDILEFCKIDNKSDAIYVGDTSVDMQTAKNAGLEAVGVTWGFRSEEELKAYHPKYIIHKAEELLDIVLV